MVLELEQLSQLLHWPDNLELLLCLNWLWILKLLLHLHWLGILKLLLLLQLLHLHWPVEHSADLYWMLLSLSSLLTGKNKAGFTFKVHFPPSNLHPNSYILTLFNTGKKK